MRAKKCCFVKIAKWWVSKILKNDGVKDRIWGEGSKLDVRGDFTSYLQDKVKKIVKKKKAISERAKLQKELDNLVWDVLEWKSAISLCKKKSMVSVHWVLLPLFVNLLLVKGNT